MFLISCCYMMTAHQKNNLFTSTKIRFFYWIKANMRIFCLCCTRIFVHKWRKFRTTSCRHLRHWRLNPPFETHHLPVKPFPEQNRNGSRPPHLASDPFGNRDEMSFSTSKSVKFEKKGDHTLISLGSALKGITITKDKLTMLVIKDGNTWTANCTR